MLKLIILIPLGIIIFMITLFLINLRRSVKAINEFGKIPWPPILKRVKNGMKPDELHTLFEGELKKIDSDEFETWRWESKLGKRGMWIFELVCYSKTSFQWKINYESFESKHLNISIPYGKLRYMEKE